MRNYPATLVCVFENKVEAGADTDSDIPLGKEDLKQATDELGINVRDVMEIPPPTVQPARCPTRSKNTATTTSLSTRTATNRATSACS